MSKIKEDLFFLLSLLTGPRPKGVRNWLISWGGTEEEKSEVGKRGETPKLALHGRPAQGGEGKTEYRMRCEILIDLLDWTFWWLNLGSSFDCRSAYNLRVGLGIVGPAKFASGGRRKISQ